MPRAIILHAGFHKTGTSTVQHTLRANRALLKPYLVFRLKPAMKDLLHAARGYSTWRDPLTLWKAERRFEALLRSLPAMPNRVLCLSAEELSGHMPGRGDLADYSAAPILAARYAAICRATFPDAALQFCFGTRDADTWLRSAWAEHVKSSSITLDAASFAARYAQAADLTAITNAVAAATACPVHRLDMAASAHAPAAPLLTLCGVPPAVQDACIWPAPVNTRLPDGVLLDLLAANRAYEDRDARRAAKTALLKAAGYE